MSSQPKFTVRFALYNTADIETQWEWAGEKYESEKYFWKAPSYKAEALAEIVVREGTATSYVRAIEEALSLVTKWAGAYTAPGVTACTQVNVSDGRSFSAGAMIPADDEVIYLRRLLRESK